MKTLLYGIAAALLVTGVAAQFAAEDHVVQINEKAFQPGRLEIKVGEKVTWKNYDLVDHTVTAQTKPALPGEQGKPLFDSGVMKPGDMFSHTFAKEGTFEYACTIHKGMTGTIVVAPLK
ncbi:MAG TPA: plastocyanin/azurin family copper-binding protein [Planctomycetota bacterium]|nr:plastocyanin/azurin family copper-binding protein [Planctomycetota bacterium]